MTRKTKMRIRHFSIICFCIIIMFSAVSCNSEIKNNKLTIVTSFYPVYITTLNIADNISDIEVINLTPITTGCLHDYQLTAADIKTLNNADVFIANGADMEPFISKIISQCPDLKIVYASDGIDLIDNNPHTWLSTENYTTYINNITNGLSTISKEHSSKFSSNREKYISDILTLKNEISSSLEGISQRDIVVFNDTMTYFAKENNLNILKSLDLEHDESLSPQELTETIDIINKSNCNALFAEPDYSSSAINTISTETGKRVYIFDPVTRGHDSDKTAYITSMRKNALSLAEALK